jgi:WD40 repeat protein
MWFFHRYFFHFIGPRVLVGAFAITVIGVVIDGFPPRETRIIAPFAVLRGHECWVRAIAWAADGKTLASAGGTMPDTAELKIWNLATAAEQASLRGHTGLIESVVFSPDGKTLASSGQDRTIRYWDVVTCKQQAILQEHTNSVPFLAFSPDGETLAYACRDNTVGLWNVMTADKPGISHHPAGWAYGMVFDADGPLVVSYGERDPMIAVWDVRQARERASFPKPPRTAQCMALSSVGQVLVAGCTDGSVCLWDIARRGEGGRMKDEPYQPDDSSFVPPSLPLGHCSCSWQGHEDLVTAIAISPEGRYVASGGQDGMVKLWEISTGREAAALKGHVASVSALAFSPDGKKIATGSYDKTVAVWKVH